MSSKLFTWSLEYKQENPDSRLLSLVSFSRQHPILNYRLCHSFKQNSMKTMNWALGVMTDKKTDKILILTPNFFWVTNTIFFLFSWSKIPFIKMFLGKCEGRKISMNSRTHASLEYKKAKKQKKSETCSRENMGMKKKPKYNVLRLKLFSERSYVEKITPNKSYRC